MNIFKKLKSRVDLVGSSIVPTRDSPDMLLGELFQDVQFRRVYPDGMTFVDLVPAGTLRKILKAYRKQRLDPRFNLHDFVQKYFKGYLEAEGGYKSNPKHTAEQHIDELWDVLTREAYKNTGSLVALPHPYIVPGGRFSAQWYWDSYFTMLGLGASGRWDLTEGMLKNFVFLLVKFGRVPSGNRTYYLSRSQPPFLSQMVRLVAESHGKTALVKYLPYLIAERKFWRNGTSKVGKGSEFLHRVVAMPDGEVMARYFDDKVTPRPESYKEDIDTALLAPERIPSKVYLDLRASAESGWDFSSRWFADPMNLASIHTTDLVAVDLNCLLVMLDQTIADAYHILRQGRLAKKYETSVKHRSDAINKYCWDPKTGFYYDWDAVKGERTPSLSLAGVFPLYAKVASMDQADAVAEVIKRDFLKEGGVVTTMVTNGQQWDAPNGWAPLQWITIQGLRNYGHHELASEIKKRWIAINLKIYKETGKMVEKYNVVDPSMSAGGGEYVLQDGFGWTNGVLMALLREDKVK